MHPPSKFFGRKSKTVTRPVALSPQPLPPTPQPSSPSFLPHELTKRERERNEHMEELKRLGETCSELLFDAFETGQRGCAVDDICRERARVRRRMDELEVALERDDKEIYRLGREWLEGTSSERSD